MTSEMEKGLLDGVERVAQALGYGRVIQVMHARWAIMLHDRHGMTWRQAALGALMGLQDLPINDETELEKVIRSQAGE